MGGEGLSNRSSSAFAFRMLLPSSVDDAERGFVDQETTYPTPSYNTPQPLFSMPAPQITVKLKKPRPVPMVTPENPVEITLRVGRLAPSHNAKQTLSLPAPQTTVKLKKPRPVATATLREVPIYPPPKKRMQKRASRWIRSQLWFNTYRSVAVEINSGPH